MWRFLNQLVSVLAKQPQCEQRRAPRYCSHSLAHLGWWQGERFHCIDASIIDVSQGGAALLIKAPPPSTEFVDLRVASNPGSDWVHAQVRGVRSLSRGRSVIHLRFVDGAAYEFFCAALPQTDLRRRGPRHPLLALIGAERRPEATDGSGRRGSSRPASLL